VVTQRRSFFCPTRSIGCPNGYQTLLYLESKPEHKNVTTSSEPVHVHHP
jgi:hypothetical protein